MLTIIRIGTDRNVRNGMDGTGKAWLEEARIGRNAWVLEQIGMQRLGSHRTGEDWQVWIGVWRIA